MAVNAPVWHLRREIEKGDAVWGRLYNDSDGVSFWSIENSQTLIP